MAYRWILCVFVWVPAAMAGEAPAHHTHKHEHDHSQDAMAAHVHGEALLQLAMEGRELVVALVSPAANLVGFEQAARTQEQKQEVDAAEARLRKIDQWLLLKGGDCVLEKSHTDFSSLRQETGAAHSTHGDIRLDAHYLCSKPDGLQALRLSLFRDFPAVKSVALEWVLGERQGAAELSAPAPGAVFGNP